MAKLKTSSRGKDSRMPLHQFVATGGKPKDFESSKGLNKNTVPGYTEKGEKYK